MAFLLHTRCQQTLRVVLEIDHVLAHSGGGAHRLDNHLPAHTLCNNYRWNYGSEEFQLILKLGVWPRTQIEKQTTLGKTATEQVAAYEARLEDSKIAREATLSVLNDGRDREQKCRGADSNRRPPGYESSG
jgi:hypothetical protein